MINRSESMYYGGEVQGPINKEPDEKLMPASGEANTTTTNVSGIRRLYVIDSNSFLIVVVVNLNSVQKCSIALDNQHHQLIDTRTSSQHASSKQSMSTCSSLNQTPTTLNNSCRTRLPRVSVVSSPLRRFFLSVLFNLLFLFTCCLDLYKLVVMGFVRKLFEFDLIVKDKLAIVAVVFYLFMKMLRISSSTRRRKYRRKIKIKPVF